MTAMNLEHQIVRSSYDSDTRSCSYTYRHHDGSEYTVTIPMDVMMKVGGAVPTANVKAQRRAHLANTITNHMQINPPDKRP